MILALRTDGDTTYAVLLQDHKTIHELTWLSGRALAEQLLPRLIDWLAEGGLTLNDLTGLIIFSGPGSFTSLRIGHTVLNTLSDSLGVPVVGAMGEHWIGEGTEALAKVKPGPTVALPHYGAEAHITKPKS